MILLLLTSGFFHQIVLTELSSARDEGVVATSSLRQETETRPPVSAWGRLGSARTDIINLSSQAGDSQAGEGPARCNGKLQRTKRIEPEPDPTDDKDSIASVTIISVPSGIVTPVTAPEASQASQPALIKQSSLPPPSSQLRTKALGQPSQSPNSGWL